MTETQQLIDLKRGNQVETTYSLRINSRTPKTPASHPFTKAELAWIEYFAYIGLQPEEIAASLNNPLPPRNLTTREIANYLETTNAKKHILKLRAAHKNTPTKAPAYPYTEDTRPHNDPTHDHNRAKHFIPELGIDTGMTWNHIELTDEELEYRKYLLSTFRRYDGLDGQVTRDLAIYYDLMTPHSFMRAYSPISRSSKPNDDETYTEAPPCPYTVSYEQYVNMGLSRKFVTPNQELFHNDPNETTAFRATLGAENGTYKWNINPDNLPETYKTGEYTSTLRELHIALALQGADSRFMEHVTGEAPYRATIEWLKKALRPDSKNADESIDAVAESSHFTPLKRPMPYTVYTNSRYQSSIRFKGLDGYFYDLLPWLNISIGCRFKPISRYISALVYKYGADAVARYCALYTPYKGLTNMPSLLEGRNETMNLKEVIEVEESHPGGVGALCLFPIPFEAVYNTETGQVLYYEELEGVDAPVTRPEYMEYAPAPVEHAIAPIFAEPEETSTKDSQEEQASETVEQQDIDLDDLDDGFLSPLTLTEEPTEVPNNTVEPEDEQEYAPTGSTAHTEVTKEPVEETSTGADDLDELPDWQELDLSPLKNLTEEPTEPQAEQYTSIPIVIPSEAPHNTEVNKEIGEYELLPGVIQQVIPEPEPEVTHTVDKHPLEMQKVNKFPEAPKETQNNLPGVSVLIPPREEPTEAPSVAHAPNVATNSKHDEDDSYTLGDLAVNTSQSVGRALWRIFEANEHALPNMPVIALAQILDTPPVSILSATAAEHGWPESIHNLVTLMNLPHPDTLLSLHIQKINWSTPLKTLANIFGVSVNQVVSAITEIQPDSTLRGMPLTILSDAFHKSQSSIIADSIGMGNLLG